MSRRALGCSLLLVATVSCVSAADWDMDPTASRLEFVASFQQAAAPGEFREFTTRLRFDPDNLDAAQLDVAIKVTSADMYSTEINDAIRSPVWFDFDGFAIAEFSATSFERTDASHFVAHGSLHLKGFEQAVDVPFAWQQAGDKATMAGEFTVARATFGIGTGEWAATDIIGPDVKVKFTVTLRKGA